MKRFGFFILGCLLVLMFAVPAVAGETGGPVYKLEWLDAFYNGTGINLPKTVAPDSLSVSPGQNYETVQRLLLTFSFSGEEEAIVPPNTVEIRLPYSIFRNAAGGNAESLVTVPLPMDTSFNYYIDTATNEIVIYNFNEISEALVFTVMIDYRVLPSNVWLPSPPEGPIAPYTNTVTADVTISRPNMPVVVDSTNTINLTYKTDSKLNYMSKSVLSGNAYATWPAYWGTAPADAADYFYIRWAIRTYYSSTSTQPFSVAITDVPGAGEGGQVAGWQFSGKTSAQANFADGWDNNLDEFNLAAKNAMRYTHPSTGGGNFYTYLYMRYPRANLVEDPAIPGRKTMRVSNQASAELTGDYGAYDTRVSNAATYLYTENNWSAPNGSQALNKYANGPATGMIDRLESAWLAGSTAAIPLHYGSYNWQVTSTQQQYKRTLDADGTPYMVDWTAVHTDNQFSFDTSTSTASNYYRLQKGDYKLTTLTLAKPVERIYGEPDAFGVANLIAQNPANYGSVKVQVATVDNPTEADWITLGTSTVNPPSLTAWTFTPADGSAPIVSTSSNINLDLTALVPGQDVLGVRFLQTTKAAEATQTYYLKTSLYPTTRVINGLRPSPTRTGDIRNSVNLYNLASTVATGGSIAADSNYYERAASVNLNRYTTASYYSKGFGRIIQNDQRKVLEMPVTLNLYDYLTVPVGFTREEALALNVLREQTEGVFYDLLPIGTMVDLNTVSVTGYGNNAAGTYSIEVINNFRDTGRSLLIARVYKQDGSQNYYYAGNTLYTGFYLRFTLLNSFDNLLDNPKYGRNYSAYESTVGALGSGVADLPPTYNFTDADAKAAFTDVNGKPELDLKRFMHAYADWSVNPPVATELGFNKLVKAPEDTAYSKETVAQGGGEYTYRLRLANRPETSSLNLIFYDSMEDRAPDTEPVFWQGTLTNIDLSHPRLTWGIEPVVYYATREVEPKNIVGDRLVVNGALNTALWTKLDLNAPYPADLKSIAVDMRFKPDGSEFILPPERSLIVSLTMRAPGDVTPYVDPIYYAWNSAYLSAQSLREGVISANAVVDVTPTKVSLRPVDLTVNKTSSSVSGTPEAPTTVYPNSTIYYMLSVKNTNAVEAITGIVLEDVIPDNLIINTAGIIYRFGTSSQYANLSTATRITLTQAGQKLSFAIDRLAGGEIITLQIPTTVAQLTGEGPFRYENTAVVTEAFGFEQEISSQTTYHQSPVTKVSLLADKILNAGGRLPKAGEFQLELTDNSIARNRVGGPYPNSGDAPYSFNIPDIYYYTPGTYYYYLREIVPTPPEPGMTYAATSYYITVRVTYDSITRTLTPTVTYRLNSPYGAVRTPPLTYVNTYRANGNFIPTIGKLVSKTTFPQSFYENKFSATLTDEFGRVRTFTNQDGVFSFGAFAFEEKDIGRVFTYTITENPGTQDSVLYDTRVITLKVKVIDLGGGVLGFEPEYWDGDTLLGETATFVNEFQATSHEMSKVWQVPANSGLTLPNPLPDVIVQLHRDGLPYGPVVTVTGASGDNLTNTTWTYTWPSIPKYKADGSGEISVYTVHEVSPPPHFQTETTGSTITNTYRPGVFTAQKLWEGQPLAPEGGIYEVSFKLYQTILGDTTRWNRLLGTVVLDGTTDTTPGLIPGATAAEDITYMEIASWVMQWTNLPANGPDPRLPPLTDTVSFEYEVRESVITLVSDPALPAPFTVDASSSASTYVTNQYTLTTFTATKEWLNGPDTRPEVTFVLWQDGAEYAPRTIGILNGTIDGTPGSVSGEHTAWNYTFENLPKFKNADLEPHVYSFREIKIDNYDQIYSGDPYNLVYNSYVPPEMVVQATKTWSGGPAADHLAPELILYHSFEAGADYPAMEPRPVTVTPTITETGAPGQYLYTWTGVKATTLSGIPYVFSLNETGEENAVIQIGDNSYEVIKTGDVTNGYAVTNKFIVPTGDGNVTKTWVGGPQADHIEIDITVHRQTSAMAQPEVVTEPQPVLTILPSGVHSYTWHNVAWTDNDGLPYTYTIAETGAVNGQYTINGNVYTSQITGFDITNTYIPPVSDITASKIWQGGPVEHHLPVELTLWHKTETMPEPELIIAEPVVTGEGPYLYTWADLELTDMQGQPYTFTVKEVSEENGFVIVGTSRYAVTSAAVSPTELTLSNTYVIPLAPVKATKTWLGGPAADHQAVILDLYRQSAQMDTPEPVNATAIITLDEAEQIYDHVWNDIEQTDFNGLPYTFTVQERGALNGVYAVGGNAYTVTIQEHDVSNLYRQPTADITATKTWNGGPETNHTVVKLILQRATENMGAPETISLPPEVSQVQPFTYIWRGLHLRDFDGLPYTYTIMEEGEENSQVIVNGYHYQVQKARPSDTAFSINNNFLPPQPFVYTPEASKTLEGARMEEGQFDFLLTDHLGETHEVTNLADGSIVLPEFTFTEPGTYAFTLKEKRGSTPGMNYDSTVFALVLVLEIDINNTLVKSGATWTANGAAVAGENPVFQNTLDKIVPTYPTIYVPLEVNKVLRNGTLKEGEFTFVLKDAQGKVLASAVNDQNGKVRFPDRSFSREVSNYLYTIEESEGNNRRIIYDKTVYTVKVTTRAQNGRLSAAVSYEKDGIPYSGELTFINARKAPATGDNALLIIAILAGLGLLAGGAAVAVRRKRKVSK